MTLKIAIGYLEQAGESLAGAGDALERGNLANATREAQVTVELSVKAALYEVRVEPPKEHDVHVFLVKGKRVKVGETVVGHSGKAAGELVIAPAEQVEHIASFTVPCTNGKTRSLARDHAA